MLKSLILSFSLGLLYLIVALSIQAPGSFWVQYFLFLFVPLPMFLVIFSFPFWVALVAFIPILLLMMVSLTCAVSINLLLTIPLLIIFLFLHLRLNKPGKYIPLLIIGYGILLFLSANFYFNKQNFSLPDLIIDTLSTLIMQLNSMQPGMLSSYNTGLLIDISAFTLPTIIIFIFYLILSTNYIFANWIVNKNSSNLYKIQIGNSLPKYYIHIFITFLIGIFIVKYFAKNNWNILYILYNIAMILFIPFLVSGCGLINHIISKNKLFLFLFIILLFFLNLYIVIAICVLGFLKEARLFNIMKLNI